MIKKMFLLGCSLFFVSACSSGGGGDNKGKVQTFHFEDKDTATKVFNASKISCQGACPEYIGGMTVYTETATTYGVGVCSLTYIGQNQVLMNRHCLMNGLDSAKNTSCSNRIKIKFPASGIHPEESFDCARVVDFSPHPIEDNNVVKPDWAVLSFTGSTKRKPAPIETASGLDNKTTFIAYPIFYSLNNKTDVISVNGVAKKMTCSTNRQTPFYLMYFSSFSPIYVGTSCSQTVIKGNSGSGIFNAAGNLTGVISYVSGTGKNMGGTNGACIPYLRAEPHHEDCAFKDNENFKSAILDITFARRAVEFKDNFVETNKTFNMNASFKLYTEGDSNNLHISEVVYQPSEDPLLTPMLDAHWREAMSDFLSKDNIQCIDPVKAAGKTEIYLPIRNVLSWKATDLEKIPVQNRILKFQLSKAENNMYVAHIDSSLFPQAAGNATKLEQMTTKCSDSKSSSFVFFDSSCAALESFIDDIQRMPVSEHSEIFTRDFLTNMDAKSLTLNIPSCE